jgi:DNA-binding MarR family transcriptional regulator
LQERALIERTPDPEDRRARQLAVTDAGRALRDAVQTDIQRGEDHLLARLPAADRKVFLRALALLAELPPEEITYSAS